MKRFLALACIAVLFAGACIADDASPPAEPKIIKPDKASPDAIAVGVKEYKFSVANTRVKAGTVDFVVTNTGEGDHEFVIVPMNDERFGIPIGEIEAFPPNERRAIRADLRPGAYAFVCLIVSVVDDQPESHMALGMRQPFEVVE